ncbi:MAG: sensor histidine kinase [Rhodocyclaceae bacterium]
MNNININNNIGKRFSSNSNSNNNNQWQLQLEIPERQQVLLLRGSKLPNNNGEVVVFDDITKIIAGERSAAWGEVARRLAHEIKNPLTPIQLSAERLQFKLEDQQLNDTNKNILQKGTQTIINQVQAMKRMVDDFREYARLPIPELKPLNINELITEMLGLYESSNAKIILNLQHNLPLVIGDATQLRQVIHNLLRNAEDALESKINDEKIITISTEISDEVIAKNSKYIKLKIADNGDGFPPELLSKIFEPYVTAKPKGTGLGLPIVKKIIEEHNGKISIKNICDAKDKNKVCGAEISIYLMQNVE